MIGLHVFGGTRAGGRRFEKEGVDVAHELNPKKHRFITDRTIAITADSTGPNGSPFPLTHTYAPPSSPPHYLDTPAASRETCSRACMRSSISPTVHSTNSSIVFWATTFIIPSSTCSGTSATSMLPAS